MTFVGVLPWVEHGLPDEDGAATPAQRPGSTSVAVVRYPTASNLDELKLLEQVADLVWAGRPNELDGADLVVLPGSKHVAADLAWLRERGLDRAIADRAARGERVVAICGGVQLLGGAIEDSAGVDGFGTGLGLLPVRTVFGAEKRTERVDVVVAALPEPWQALSGLTFSGYEIRHGEIAPTGPVAEAIQDGRGYVAGAVLGLTLHGALESPDVVAALVGRRPTRHLETVFDDLADLVEQRLDVEALARLAGVA
jgi:adenosylcobyric acid synthase